ncbi:MAG: NAD-dependent deacylase [Epsilonproteobacteria bacterium]|nr:NAD-dependent deacylase [Campylobacterota bacterium]
MDTLYKEAAKAIKDSKYCVAFTGAGISVESGIPTFRGPTGLWSKYDPKILDIDFFINNPKESWHYIKEIFYDYMGDTKPNDAHKFLAKLEDMGQLKGIVTQNIDNLHQEAGSKNVVEFHGTASKMLCMGCGVKYDSKDISLNNIPPYCKKCGGLLKPDFVFFGEPIPPKAQHKAIELCTNADVLIIIGTTGEIMPASQLPYMAKKAKIIEINIEKSNYTETITDIFLQDKATVACNKIYSFL